MGQRLGKYIKNARREKKVSAKNLSAATGISKSYIDYIESGAREPQIEMLARIAAVLNAPLETMINIQKREQMEAAITKLSVENVEFSDGELRAVGRAADSSQTIAQKALAQTREAFRTAPDDKTLAECFENPELKAIARAGATLSDEDLEKLRKVMESLYPDAFKQE